MHHPDSKPAGVSRRTAVAASLGAMIVPRHVLGGAGYQAPSDTLRIAAVGIGGMGRRYIQGCESQRIVALCDVDHTFAAPVFRKYPAARPYRDYRVMFDKEANNIDAVIVATPDHSHSLVTLAALGLRKHVYCAKPLTHNIAEGRKVLAAVRQAGVATQMSVQSCASDEACSTAELLMSGAIGAVREVHVWCDHPLYPAGLVRPTDQPAVPAGLDWDLWIGPAASRPYHPAYHPWIWRSWWDFGSGTVGDMLCHAMHVFFNALELGDPTLVYGSRSTMHTGVLRMEPDGREYLPPRVETPETESYSSLVSWHFPARGRHPQLAMHWYDGGLRPHRPMELDPSVALPTSGLLFIGDKGKLLSGYYGGSHRLLPEANFKDFQPPPKSLPRSSGHYTEWLDACKGGKPANCHFPLAARMNEITQLGVLAARRARVLQWDPAAMRITNDKEADALINPAYRAGWGR